MQPLPSKGKYVNPISLRYKLDNMGNKKDPSPSPTLPDMGPGINPKFN